MAMMRRGSRGTRVLQLEGAPSDEHEEIRSQLDEWALALGFGVNLKRLQHIQPDVFRGRLPRGLFMGDAKVSANETPDVEATAERISKYVEWFVGQFEDGRVSHGVFAIATDDEVAAGEWVAFLDDEFGHEAFCVQEHGAIWIACATFKA